MTIPRIRPDGSVKIAVQPNSRPAIKPHTECWRQEWHSPMGRLGDVRRCIHGEVQVLTQISEHARIQGPGTHWWRTLSRFWNPVLYRRARAALGD